MEMALVRGNAMGKQDDYVKCGFFRGLDMRKMFSN